MSSEEVREKFLKYFERNGHAIVPSSSLVPSDPSVLLTTAGMQQFKDYYTGEADPMKDFGAKSTASIQKTFRTSDIEEAGDSTHNTFFEMMGNFSFGGYGKKEAITYAHEFITKEMGLTITYATIFEGSHGVPKDEESKKIWQELGVSDVREEGIEDVFWGPTGNAGPCGPSTELYCKDASGEDVEVWNIVFNEYFYPGSREELLAGDSEKELRKLETFGVDTGMGFERLMSVYEGNHSSYESDLFSGIMEKIEEYGKDLPENVKRIIADHVRGAAFIIADGILPSNKDAGYLLRRLLRRVIAYEVQYDIHTNLLAELVPVVSEKYGRVYEELKDVDRILEVIEEEKKKFRTALTKGLKELTNYEKISAAEAFKLYESYGLPFELIMEFAPKGVTEGLTREDFDKEFEKHKEKSRAGLEKKFGGHGLILDTGELKAGSEEEMEKVIKLHTATHLMQAAIKKVLGEEVGQRGSDITAERTRFDFTFPRKVTREELDEVEKIVNEAIEKDLPRHMEEMPYEEALKIGALFVPGAKYPETVKVFYFGDSLDDAFSKEICGGPHVEHAGVIGKFSIKKEQAVSAGVRRVRGVIE